MEVGKLVRNRYLRITDRCVHLVLIPGNEISGIFYARFQPRPCSGSRFLEKPIFISFVKNVPVRFEIPFGRLVILQHPWFIEIKKHKHIFRRTKTYVYLLGRSDLANELSV